MIYSKEFLKAGFHMIADRRSQIADKVCDRLRSCDRVAEDRTMFYLKAGFHMIADRRSRYDRGSQRLRSAIIWKPAFNAITDGE